MFKICAYCKKEKDLSQFNKNLRNLDGLHSYCKECNKNKAKEFNKTDKGKENVKNAQLKQFNSGYFRYGKGAILNMKNSAIKRRVQFNLTEENLNKWWHNSKNKCFYCGSTVEDFITIKEYIINYGGSDLTINRYKRFFDKDIYKKIKDMTIDRKDNSKGYEIDNIVKSCWICNSLKSDFYTENEMKIVGKLIIKSIKDIMGRSNNE